MLLISAVRHRAAALASDHWLLCILLAVGLMLRVITWLAYQPALLAIDSFGYIRNLETMRMDGFSPIGYDLILTALLAIGSPLGAGLAFTSAVQHLVGLVVAVLLYVTALRLGARRWVAALITVPVLVDGYQLQIEQSVMSESWSALVLVGAVSLLLAWTRHRDAGAPVGPSWQVAAIVGVLLACSVTIRLINIVVLVPFLVYLILVGANWRDRRWWRSMLIRTTAGIAGFAVLLGAYVVAFRADTGRWGLSGGRTPSIIYGRAATIADCDRLDLDPTLQKVCPTEPKDDRLGIDAYTHHRRYRLIDLPPGRSLEEVRNEFAWTVVREQPLEFTGTILRDFAKGFAWRRTTSPRDVPLSRWQFQLDYPRWKATDANVVTQRYDRRDPKTVPALTAFLRSYQLTVGYIPGTILGLCGLIGLVALVIRRGHLPSAAVLVAGTGFVLLFGAAIFEFSWRYQLPALLFFPLAAAIGLTAASGRRASIGQDRDMDLPVMPPVKPMLAKSVKTIPTGELAYEPKWDGFRSIVFRDGDEVEIGSRNERPMTRYFPEMVQAFRELLPQRCVIDGELIMVAESGDRLDFDLLQQRIHPAASRVTMLSETTPARFVAFDLLALDDEDYTVRPYDDRRQALQEALSGVPAPVHLTPITTDPELAEQWFNEFEGAGLDGVVAKRQDQPYQPDKRTMFKIKHQRTADCVVAGYRTHKSGPDAIGSLLLGLHDTDGTYGEPGALLSVGVIGAFSAVRRKELFTELQPLVTTFDDHPWSWAKQQEGTRTPRNAEGSRWSGGKDLSFTPLRPERVVEVRYEHMEGNRFRHTAQFNRWRPDRTPESCTYAQLDEPVSFDLGEILAP